MIQALNIPLSLYVHIPWCVRKCPYCDFNSHTHDQDLPQQNYVAALLADLKQDLQLTQGRKIQSIFIGGGTPSLFSAASIGQLLEGIKTLSDCDEDMEVTMEANPGTLEYDKFSEYRAAGVNRVSIGVQSFDDLALQQLGRIHNSGNAQKAIEAVIAAGFDNWNLDLMHGLPGQSVALAMQDLKTAISYDPPHVSWYQLTIEPNTAFYSAPPVLPEDDKLADIQDAGEAMLVAAGFEHYEVSAWGKKRCRHNMNYWRFGDYLGIGAGAHSKISLQDGSIQRSWKKRQPDSYLDALEDHKFAAGQRSLTQEDRIFEFFLNTLRLYDRLPKALFTERTGLDWAVIEETVSTLEHQKLLSTGPSDFATTELGQRFLNDVLQRFMAESNN